MNEEESKYREKLIEEYKYMWENIDDFIIAHIYHGDLHTGMDICQISSSSIYRFNHIAAEANLPSIIINKLREAGVREITVSTETTRNSKGGWIKKVVADYDKNQGKNQE